MSRIAVADRTAPTLGSTLRSVLSRRAALMPTVAAVAIFVTLLVGAPIYFGNFVTPLNMSALLLDNAFLLILAVGMTFVILTRGGRPVGGEGVGPARGVLAQVAPTG